METLLQLQTGSKSFGPKLLFDGAAFAINEGEHAGVIGPNGAGKTTLFKILIGDETLDSGQVIKSRRLRLGYLSQHDHWSPDETIESYVTRDATLPIWELKAIGRGLGLEEEHFHRHVASFSGGYRMRAKLLALIAKQPNLMLLDEPTNYLDLETVMVLEKFLQSYDGAFLLISHDREFLRRTTDHTVEVEGGQITKYNGNIDDYFEQKELLRAQLEARAMSLEEKRKSILDFVARFGAKATKASQAQSRLKQLDKMESIEVKPLPVTARIRIPAPQRVGKLVIQVKDADLGYSAERTILQKVSLQLSGNDHMAVVGLNGAGKSTLLKAIAGKLSPQRGSIEFGYEVTLAYFAQHTAEELLPEDTVFRAMERKAHASVTRQEILDLAGSLLFSGDDVQKPIRVLSGGEKSRVALGQVLLQKASCLVLDEPTNHLDFQTVEALTQALKSYEGSLVVVSHDRGFISRVGTKLLEIHEGKASTYPGTYDDYVWSLERGAYATLRTTAPGTPSQPAKSGGPQQSTESPAFTYKEKKKELDRKVRQCDNTIADMDKKLAKHQQRLAILNEELAKDSTSAEGVRKIQEMGKLQEQIDECEATWLAAAEEKEQVLQELKVLTGA